MVNGADWEINNENNKVAMFLKRINIKLYIIVAWKAS